MYVCIYTGFFPLGGWGESLPPTNLEKSPPSRLPHLPPIFYHPPPPPAPATKQQFSSYKPIKTAFLAVVIALAPFLF